MTSKANKTTKKSEPAKSSENLEVSIFATYCAEAAIIAMEKMSEDKNFLPFLLLTNEDDEVIILDSKKDQDHEEFLKNSKKEDYQIYVSVKRTTALIEGETEKEESKEMDVLSIDGNYRAEDGKFKNIVIVFPYVDDNENEEFEIYTPEPIKIDEDFTEDEIDYFQSVFFDILESLEISDEEDSEEDLEILSNKK